MRPVKKILATVSVLLVSGYIFVINPVLATDGDPIMDLGIFNWIKYQQKKFFTDIVEISIENGAFNQSNVKVSIYEPIFFENKDSENHRLVFLPGLDNKMDYPYTSSVIKPEERWGLEIHVFGVFPFQCTLHPEEKGRFTVKL